MRINFVTETEQQRWVLRYWAESLSAHIKGAAVSTKQDDDADFNIFINYALHRPVPTKTAAMFTHREREGVLLERFIMVAGQVDWCFAQCDITAALLPANKTSVLRMYPLGQFYKGDAILGVVAAPKASGRKRFHWVQDLEAIPGIKVEQACGGIPMQDMPQFYKGIDYLVILADNEGGPMPLLEAMAMGVPVIAPNVGHCWDFPVLRYSSKEDLLMLVKGLVVPKDGWKTSAAELVQVCKGIL